MGIINIYNQIDNTHQTISGKGKLKDLLPNFNFKKAIILKAGNKLDENYFLQTDDVIFIRKVPGVATVGTALAIAGAVAIGVAAVGVTAVGISNYINGCKRLKEKEQAQQNAKKLAEQINQFPFIKGAKNKNAIGQSVPYIMGNVYHTPYKITDGFYSISGTYGEKQYFNVVLDLGFGKVMMSDFFCGEEKILSLTENQSKKTYSFDKSSLFYDAENKIETVFPGDDFSNSFFKQKVVSVQDGSEIKHDFGENAEEVIRTLSDYTQKVEICIQFNGLREYKYSDNGDGYWTERKAIVRPYWSNDDGKTWNEFYFSGMTKNEINLNKNKTIRFLATKTFTAQQAYGKTIKIKIVKETPKAESNTNEDCFLLFYNCFCYDNEKSSSTSLVACKTVEDDLINKTTRVGIRMIANDNSNGTLEEFHITCNSIAKTYNSTTKTWSSTKQATRNPASIILEILTSDYHKASKFLESEIDLNSLGNLYKYCDENKFYTDGILTSEQKKRDLLSTILDSVGATIFINSDGLLEFAIDKKEDTPVALLNAENLTNITYTKDLSRKVDGIKVTYTDRKTWQTNTFYAMLDGGKKTDDDICSELALDYVTDYSHAYKIAQKKLRQLILQPKEISVNVGREGDYYPLYSTVMLQYTTFRQGICSSVITGLEKDKSGNITDIVISDTVDFESGKSYGVIIQAISNQGKKFYSSKVSGSGRTNKLKLKNAISSQELQPELDNNISFGILDENENFTKITNLMKIVEITPNAKNSLTLKLVDYNEAIYETGTIPEYKSNITTPPKQISSFPDIYKGENGKDGNFGKTEPNNLISVSAVASKDSIQLGWVLSTGLQNSLKNIEYQIKRGETAEWKDINVSSDNKYFFDRKIDGYPESDTLLTWKVRAKAVNIYNKKSDYTETALDVSQDYGTWQIGNPVITSRVSGRNVTLFFEQPTRADKKTVYGSIRYKVQVKKTSETSYFKPALSKNPYDDEANYKDGSGFVISGETFQQVLPLSGQKDSKPTDTNYTYQVIAYNEANESQPVTINVIALGTSVKDIVAGAITEIKIAKDAVTHDKVAANAIGADQIVANAITAVKIASKAITSEKINVSNLSAIKADLGTVTAGELKKDKLNFWNLTKGTFRIGTETCYLHFDGNDLALSLTTFFVSAIASVIKGVFEVQDGNGTNLVIANPYTTEKEGVSGKTVKIIGDLLTNGNIYFLDSSSVKRSIRDMYSRLVTLEGTPSNVMKGNYGYLKFKSGFTIQWGKEDTTGTSYGYYKELYYPIAFKTVYTVVVCGRPSSQWEGYAIGVQEITNTYFKTSEKYCNYYSWIAIGTV